MNQEQRRQAKRKFFDRVERLLLLAILDYRGQPLPIIIARVYEHHHHDDADVVTMIGLMRLQHKDKAVIRTGPDGKKLWSKAL